MFQKVCGGDLRGTVRQATVSDTSSPLKCLFEVLAALLPIQFPTLSESPHLDLESEPVLNMLVGVPTQCVALLRFVSWLHSLFKLAVNVHTGRQQVIADTWACQPLPWETQIEFLAPSFGVVLASTVSGTLKMMSVEEALFLRVFLCLFAFQTTEHTYFCACSCPHWPKGILMGTFWLAVACEFWKHWHFLIHCDLWSLWRQR